MCFGAQLLDELGIGRFGLPAPTLFSGQKLKLCLKYERNGKSDIRHRESVRR